MKQLKQLLEDYQRRLKTISELIMRQYDGMCPDLPEKRRLLTKKGCYQSFISELEIAIKEHEEAMPDVQHLDILIKSWEEQKERGILTQTGIEYINGMKHARQIMFPENEIETIGKKQQ